MTYLCSPSYCNENIRGRQRKAQSDDRTHKGRKALFFLFYICISWCSSAEQRSSSPLSSRRRDLHRSSGSVRVNETGRPATQWKSIRTLMRTGWKEAKALHAERFFQTLCRLLLLYRIPVSSFNFIFSSFVSPPLSFSFTIHSGINVTSPSSSAASRLHSSLVIRLHRGSVSDWPKVT